VSSIAYWLPIAIIAATACKDDGPTIVIGGGGTGAPGPTIIAPTARVIVPSTMTIQTEAGPAGHQATEFELMPLARGEAGAAVWRATVNTGVLTSATLADGSFEAGTTQLDPWSRYAIRARHQSAAGGLTDWGPNYVIRTDDGSEAVFDGSTIGDARLQLSSESYASIDSEAISESELHPRSYYVGDLNIGGVDFPGSGLRAKGATGSSRSLDKKTAFKINLSWDDPAVAGCPVTRRYRGLKKITLNNQVEDKSYVHERIGYDFLRKLGVPVPRVAPIRVHVNGDLWGLYLHIESIDRRFLARRFDSKDGMLYEADYDCDLGRVSCFEPKFSTDSCDDPPKGDPTDATPLLALNERLAALPSGGFYPAIDEIVDFDLFLSTWAAGSVMGYWDGYPKRANNYRIYHDPSDDRWTIIPSGLDQLFEDDVDPFKPAHMLSNRCLAEDACEAAFRVRLAQVLDLFEASNYTAMARAIEAEIQADVEADPRREFDLNQWAAGVDSTVEYIENRPGRLRALLYETTAQRNRGKLRILFRSLSSFASNL
jgi:hypothetical protein